MPYQAELNYLLNVLDKLHIQALRIRNDSLPGQQLDMGLRKTLKLEDEYDRLFQLPAHWVRANVIYKLTDPFSCNYIFMQIPASPEADTLLIGPYLTKEITREQLLEEAERYGVPARRVRQLETCYADIPVLRDESAMLAAAHVLCETLWGKGTIFSVIDERQSDILSTPSPLLKEENLSPDEIMLHMKAMENRYSYENKLMELVSQGQSHRAEMMMNNFSKLTIEQRTVDPVRNLKNYCIICNTLLRKAAEQGGVHPVYLDSTSSELARKVESLTAFDEGVSLMREMVRSYCWLVRQHSIHHYSPLVQKTIAYIEADLSGDLSLHALAILQNVSPGYLSTLFRKETGKTVTDFVTQRRMEHAAKLLRTTSLQIQTIAQHCGISDVNYFSKLFKRHYSMTPRQFREESRPPLPHQPYGSR